MRWATMPFARSHRATITRLRGRTTRSCPSALQKKGLGHMLLRSLLETRQDGLCFLNQTWRVVECCFAKQVCFDGPG